MPKESSRVVRINQLKGEEWREGRVTPGGEERKRGFWEKAKGSQHH